MADDTRGDETPDEREEAAETDATPEEAHREGEFDDIRDRIESIAARADEILAAVRTVREAVEAFVGDGGAVVRDTDDDGDVDEVEVDDVDLDTPIEDLDLNIDED